MTNRLIHHCVRATVLLTFFLGIQCASSKKFNNQLVSPNTESKKNAIIEVMKMGKRAQNSTPYLIKIILDEKDADTRRLAVDALGAIRPEMNKSLNNTLICALQDRCPYVRSSMIGVIGEMQQIPANVLHVMRKNLADTSSLVRDIAISTFEKVGPICTHVLIRSLKDPNPLVRCNAILVLGRLKHNAKQAITALEDAQINDADTSVRAAATRALKDLSYSQ